MSYPLRKHRKNDMLRGMNWKTIISDLQGCGLTQTQIAEHCDCGQATVSELLTGKTTMPRYDIGAKLLELHKVKMRRARRAQPERVAALEERRG